MKAIETLVGEHKMILKFLDNLLKAAEQIKLNQGPPREFFEAAVDFARSYADKHHHFKEEYTMFRMLAQKHNGALDAQIEKNRQQHEQCRNLIQKISESLSGYKNKLESSTETLQRSVVEYVNTLRSHIQSESEVFFPMAKKALSPSEDSDLLKEFAKYEKKAGGHVKEVYIKRVAEMSAMLQHSQRVSG